MQKKLALLYARVSTYKQAEIGHSLETQSAALIAKAEAEGYRVELVLDNGSGRKMNRPKLNEAIERLNRGEAQALFAVDLDRLARNTKHSLELVETAKKHNWRLVILSFDLDTGTAIGKLMFSQLASFAEFESGLTSQRVMRQHEARRARGIVWGVDQGYKGNLDPRARKLIIKERAKGLSLREIAKVLEAKGIPTVRGGEWKAGTIKTILDSPQTELLTRKEARKELTAQDKQPVSKVSPKRLREKELAVMQARKILDDTIEYLREGIESGSIDPETTIGELRAESLSRREARKLFEELDKGSLSSPGDETPTRWELRKLYLEGVKNAANRAK